jgi:hypothetical protein
VQEENLGSTRKFVENHLLFMCITNKIIALCEPYTHGALMGWRNFSKTAEKKSSSPCAAGVVLLFAGCDDGHIDPHEAGTAAQTR